MKKVLLLGAGNVASPCVQYLIENDIAVTAVSMYQYEIDALTTKYKNVTPIVADINKDKGVIERLVGEHDITISLLPHELHPEIVEMCIKQKKNMVTASYLTQDMRAYHDKAVEAGIIVMNEVGLDPGIDHFLALNCFKEVGDQGGKIESFTSWCGGLPAIEFSNNPLRYKFSWYPKGALQNMKSSAKWLENNEVKTVHSGGSLCRSLLPINFWPELGLEGIPNRDSTVYKDLYSLEDSHTVFRGTLRYKGYCEAIDSLIKLGLLEDAHSQSLDLHAPDITWNNFIKLQLELDTDSSQEIVLEKLLAKFNGNENQVKCVDKLGLLDDVPIIKKGTPLSTLSNYLSTRLSYGEKERDVILMRHDVGILWPDGRKELRHINLIIYGSQDEGGFSAMAKTVGYPVGIATKMILEGKVEEYGMMLPFNHDICLHILSELKHKNIVAHEQTTCPT